MAERAYGCPPRPPGNPHHARASHRSLTDEALLARHSRARPFAATANPTPQGQTRNTATPTSSRPFPRAGHAAGTRTSRRAPSNPTWDATADRCRTQGSCPGKPTAAAQPRPAERPLPTQPFGRLLRCTAGGAPNLPGPDFTGRPSTSLPCRLDGIHPRRSHQELGELPLSCMA